MQRVVRVRVLKLIGMATFVAIVTAVAVFDLYLVTSPSMATTLLPGDLVLVNQSGHALAMTPRRGEIWVFRPQSGGRERKVKRVIALPGDTVSMIANIVLVNGIPVRESYKRPASGRGEPDHFSWQRQYLVPSAKQTDYWPTLSDWGPLVVPTDSHFLLGDNRGTSVDSRHEGFVHADRFVGRVVWIPFSYGIPGSNPSAVSKVVRWGRIGRIP